MDKTTNFFLCCYSLEAVTCRR